MAGIKIQIDGENRSAAAVTQAQQGVQRLSEQVKNLSQQTVTGTAKSQDFAKGLQEMARQAIPATGNMGRLAQSLSQFNVGAGLAVAAVTAIGTALVSAAHGVADYQESMDIASRTTGLTTGQLAGLKVAASESGRSFEQLRPSLDFFTRKIGEAADGSKEAQKAFNDLGVATKVGEKIRETGDILRDVQVALNGISDPAVRAQKAFDLFGRGAAASMEALLTPIDQATERAQKLGIAFGPEAEKVARQADKAFDSLKTSVQGIGNAFGIAAAKMLNPFLSTLAKVATEVAKFNNDPKMRLAITLPGTTPESFWSGFASRAAGGGFVGQRTVPSHGGPVGPLAPSSVTDAINKEIEARMKLVADLDAERKRVVDEARFWAGVGPLSAEGGRMGPMALRPLTPDWQERLNQQAEAGGMTPGGQIEMPKVTKAIDDLSDQTLNFAHNLGAALEDSITAGILRAKDLGEAFEAIGQSILEEIVGAGVHAFLGRALPFLFQSGGTLAMQSGGTVAFDSLHPIHAQSGLVVRGTRGVDSVPAMLGRGETVLDHSITDGLREFLREARNDDRGGQRERNVTVHAPIHIHTALADPTSLREITRKQIIPAVRDALKVGDFR